MNPSASLEDQLCVQTRNLADLKRKSVRGGMVTFASQGASFVIQLTSTIVLARLLTPDDYGIMAMVMAVTTFAGLFRDLGLSAAAIQKDMLTDAQQSNFFWVNVAVGTVLGVALVAASPLVAWFYHRPEVQLVTIAVSIAFPIGSLATQSSALLVREMRFARQMIATVSAGLISLAVSIALALKGFGYWSLVWGQVAGALSATILLFVLSPFRPGLPSRGTGLKEMLKFGANVTAFDFVNYFHRNLDNVLIGRFWGTEALGLYSRAYSLLMFPINNLRGPINAVAFPAMSRLQNQPDAFRAYYRRITALLAFLSMPLSTFLFLEARNVISITLGSKWDGVVPIFAILASVSFVQPVITLWGMVALSSGMARRYLHLGIFNTFCTVIGFAVGLAWGPVGVATGYAAATYLTVYPLLAWTFRGTPLRIHDFLSSIARPLCASIASLLISLITTAWFSGFAIMPAIAARAAFFFGSFAAIFFCLPGGRLELQRLVQLLPFLARPTAASSG